MDHPGRTSMAASGGGEWANLSLTAALSFALDTVFLVVGGVSPFGGDLSPYPLLPAISRRLCVAPDTPNGSVAFHCSVPVGDGPRRRFFPATPLRR